VERGAHRCAAGIIGASAGIIGARAVIRTVQNTRKSPRAPEPSRYKRLGGAYVPWVGMAGGGFGGNAPRASLPEHRDPEAVVPGRRHRLLVAGVGVADDAEARVGLQDAL